MPYTSRPHRPHRITLRSALILVALAMFSVACGSSETDTDDLSAADTPTVLAGATQPTATPEATNTTEPSPPSATAEPAAIPEPTAEQTASDETPTAEAVAEPTASDETPAAETLNWVVALLNNPAPDAAEIEERFSPMFLAQVPTSQILGLLPQLSIDAQGPWAITSSTIDTYAAEAVINAPGSAGLNVMLEVGAAAPNQIEGLLFTPVVDVVPVGSIDEYTAALADIAPISRVGAFEIIDGECETLFDLGATELMPIGSIFKLWILVELAHQVESGDAAWDEVFPVQDRYKASPDGTIFNMTEGDDVTLQRYAELMISISDNSATDHLLHRLGRTQVEAAMTPSGVADPSLNMPFLSASDLFMIKFHPDQPNSADYRALASEERRAVLDEMQEVAVPWIDGAENFPMVNADGVPLSEPRDHDLEWFATPADLCRTHAYLATLAATPGLEPVAEILNINPTAGMKFDRETWSDLRYKGGSEQGLVAVAWWMERTDGRVFVLAGGVEDPDAPLNTVLAVAALHQAVSLIGMIE